MNAAAFAAERHVEAPKVGGCVLAGGDGTDRRVVVAARGANPFARALMRHVDPAPTGDALGELLGPDTACWVQD